MLLIATWSWHAGNESGEKMSMTTPVFTSEAGRMQFVVGKSNQVGSTLAVMLFLLLLVSTFK